MLLHFRKSNKATVLEEAKARIDKLCHMNFKDIAVELHHQDQFQYLRAFSSGIQEFIEAYTFFEFLLDKELSDWDQIQEHLKYPEDGSEIFLRLVPSEFILGVADLTGLF